MGGWDGNGNVTLTYDFTDDDDAGVDILSERMDTQFEDVRGGIENSLAKDGQNAATANINLGGFKLLSVGNATLTGDAVNIATLQKLTGIYVGTVGGTGNAITLTPSPAIVSYSAGQCFVFKAAASQTSGAPTVNVSGLGTKTIKRADGNGLMSGAIGINSINAIVYDGTDFLHLSGHVGPLNLYDKLIQRPVLRDYGETISQVTIASNAATFDVENGNHFEVTLNANLNTMTVSNPAASGTLCGITFILKQDATGGRTITWPAAFIGEDGATFSYSGSDASSVARVYAETINGGTTWRTKLMGYWLA